MFGDCSGYYDRLERWSSTARYAVEVKALRSRLGPTAAGAVLDLGCGTGQAMSLFASRHAYAVGLDRSSTWAARMRERPAVRGDAALLPFRDDSFAAAVLVHVLAHLEDPARCLAEVRRVLRDGGRLGLLTPNRPYVDALRAALPGGDYTPDPTVEEHFRLDELVRLVDGAGFRITTARQWGARS